MAQLLIGFVVGAPVWFWLGRLRAEVGRAMHEGSRAMKSRASYRKG